MALSDYRLLDQVALAVERGNEQVLSGIPRHSLGGLGVVVELLVLSRANKAFTVLFSRCQASDARMVRRVFRAHPAEPACYAGDDGDWAFLPFPDVADSAFELSVHRFQLALQQRLRFSGKNAKAKLCGAIGELVDNVAEHSKALRTGILAFRALDSRLEIVVGDAGIGILESLRSNPAWSYLDDAGSAMAAALQDGVSRFGPAMDRGYGFGTLFRALNTLDADLRFRSGDYALEISGRSPTLRRAHISQKAMLRGFVISISLPM